MPNLRTAKRASPHSRRRQSHRLRSGVAGQPLDDQTLLSRWQQQRDEHARDELVRRYTPLTRGLARRYGNSSEPFDDLMQVAQLGLVKALDRYDPERGFPFKSFAVPTILGEMRRYFRDCGWAVHVPRAAQERALRVRDADQQLSEERGRAPTVGELAEYLELDVGEVIDARQALNAYRVGSLEAPRNGGDGDGDVSYADSIGFDDDGYELVELSATASAALRQIEPRRRELLRLRFIEELTQTEIAERIGVSQMQVSRLLKGCMRELRELSGAASAPA